MPVVMNRETRLLWRPALLLQVNPSLGQSRTVIEEVPWSRQRGESLSGLPMSPLNDLQLMAFRESTADLMLMEQFGQRLHVKVVVVVHFFVCRDQKLRHSDGSSH